MSERLTPWAPVVDGIIDAGINSIILRLPPHKARAFAQSLAAEYSAMPGGGDSGHRCHAAWMWQLAQLENANRGAAFVAWACRSAFALSLRTEQEEYERQMALLEKL